MKNKKISRCILKYMPLYLLIICLMILHRYLNSFTGLFIGEILAIFNNDESILPEFFTRYVNGDTREKVVTVSFIYMIVITISVIANFTIRQLRSFHYLKLYVSLSTTFYEHVIDIPRKEYVNRSTGDVIQRNIEDCRRIPLVFRNSVYELFKIVFSTGTLLLQLYLLNKSIFFISLIALVVCISFSAYYGYFKIKKKEIESSKYYSDLNSTIQQSITNYSLVKSFSNEEDEYNKFKEINDKKESNNYDINNLRCRYWLISDCLTSVYIVTCMCVLGYLFFMGNISLAVVSACAVIITGFLNEGTHLVNHITTFVKTFISVKRLNEYFNIPSEYKQDGTIEAEMKGNIEFKHVYMKYEEEYVLKDISFELKEGQTLGIVGKSGSGKTSLINLLTKLDDYQEGSVTVDGIELKDYKKKCIRENMGIVLQDAYIFSRTIKENLTILIDNDREDLDMYLSRVGLDEDINKFESGLETVVGERGVTLSGGQRQRLSLVRTIMKQKNILILDDTLSAVDNIVARKIKDSISKQQCTTIIISHNLLNVKDADKILVLEDGKIAACGTHDELIKQEGFYSNVWNLQQMIGEVEE